MKKYFSLFICFLFFSCSKKEVNYVPHISKTYTFNKTYNSYNYGTFRDSLNNNIIYFCEPVTHKVIKFYKEDGAFLDSIYFTDFGKKINSSTIVSVDAFSKNKILFTSHEALMLGNNNGEIYKYIFADSVFKNNKIPYLFTKKTNTQTIENDIITDLEYNITEKSIPVYHLNSLKHPNIARIENIFSKNASIKIINKNYYNDFFKKQHAYGDFLNYRKIKNNHFIYSRYSDEILEYNDSFKLLKKIKIQSDFIKKIGAKLYSIEEAGNADFSKEPNSKATIANVFYLNNSYYIVVFHPMDIEKVNTSELYHKDFSIIKYDSNWNKIEEIPFLDKKHMGHFIIQTSEGLLIKQYNDDKENSTFSLFN